MIILTPEAEKQIREDVAQHKPLTATSGGLLLTALDQVRQELENATILLNFPQSQKEATLERKTKRLRFIIDELNAETSGLLKTAKIILEGLRLDIATVPRSLRQKDLEFIVPRVEKALELAKAVDEVMMERV